MLGNDLQWGEYRNSRISTTSIGQNLTLSPPPPPMILKLFICLLGETIRVEYWKIALIQKAL